MSGEFVVPLPMIMSLANVVSGKIDERLLVFGYNMLFKFHDFLKHCINLRHFADGHSFWQWLQFLTLGS